MRDEPLRLALPLIGAVLCFGAAPLSAKPSPAASVPLGAQIVVMGEEHDAPEHHRNQAKWIERLRPAAVVFEMLPPDLGPVAEQMRGRPTEELDEALEWSERGWPDFATYVPIFRAIPEGSRIVGAEAPRAHLTAAMEHGAAAGFRGADRFGLSEPLPEAEQATREAEQMTAHCDLLPAAAAAGMVEAQRLRDALLADTALSALDATGGPVAVVTGNGHARSDHGIPALIQRSRPDVEVVSIGQFTARVSAAPHDAWVVTDPPTGRDPDPCAALR